MSMSMSMINWNGRNAIISSYWVCLFTKFRWWLHRTLRLAWITWIPFILWFFMIQKNSMNIDHGFMNATFIYEGYEHRSWTIIVHSYVYEKWSLWSMIMAWGYEHRSLWSLFIMVHAWMCCSCYERLLIMYENCWS